MNERTIRRLLEQRLTRRSVLRGAGSGVALAGRQGHTDRVVGLGPAEPAVDRGTADRHEPPAATVEEHGEVAQPAVHRHDQVEGAPGEDLVDLGDVEGVGVQVLDPGRDQLALVASRVQDRDLVAPVE